MSPELKNLVTFDLVVNTYCKDIKDFFFIEIGAGDGGSFDPLRQYILKYNWRGILIEPVKYLFKRLLTSYPGNKDLIFENVAVSNKIETRNIFRFKEHLNNVPAFKKILDTGIPPWYEGYGSFSMDSLRRNYYWKHIPKPEDYVITEEVDCVTFKHLLKKHNIKKIDLLQIDTEGQDYNILKSIDFDIIKPKIIKYEHKHLSSDDYIKSITLLKKNGYITFKDGHDTTGYLNLAKAKTGK